MKVWIAAKKIEREVTNGGGLGSITLLDYLTGVSGYLASAEINEQRRAYNTITFLDKYTSMIEAWLPYIDLLRSLYE
jgi:hypothetical protein